ncbi:uncharacterized protein LOC125851980 [Solanum stenotomum]|uniref:uncharacterized protein LOC125851980 n=1 Tax=Solanum stenotomum TaxID=172797 RepID=UPI0020D04D90|nr:uncharacterized protein LOC125851980 [Solanum stenotomum]
MFFIIFILLLNCLNFLYYSAKSWFLFVKTKKAEFFLIRNCYFYWLQMQSGECSVVAPHSPPWKFSTFEEDEMHETEKTSSIVVSKSFNASATKGSRVHNSCGVAGNFIIMTALRSKILTLRDLLDLSPCFGSASLNELLILTLKDLHKMYPSVNTNVPLSSIDGAGMDQALQCFCDTLKSIGTIWTGDDEFIMKLDEEYSNLHNDLRRYGLVLLDEMIKLATERVFDMMDEDDQTRDESPSSDAFGRALPESHSDNESSLSSPPPTPTSVLSSAISASLKSELKAKTIAQIKNLPLCCQALSLFSPVGEYLDKAESYFNKIKVEIDTLERTKDEEAKKFISHNIHFDFGILIRIKELMIDVSSNCMELAMKESREAKTKENRRGGSKNGSRKLLWKAFQFAFRVYSFAGGQDDRADKLTRELAQEIQRDPNQ